MKFCKRYQDYMRRREDLPSVGLKRLKKILKRCRRECQSQGGVPAKQLRRGGGGGGGGGGEDIAGGGEERGGGLVADGSRCADNCPVCDGTFFPALLDEMAAVVGCFNDRARKLLEPHLASGVRKYLVWIKGKLHGGGGGGGGDAVMHRGKDLVNYAIINAVAMRKILKKYDKIHYSRQGQAFKSKAQVLRIEILQSPWLCELMAFYVNLRISEDHMPPPISGPFEDCSLTFDGDAPTLSCGGSFDSLKLEINLTCSICLETVFDPVALTCGHIFCYTCCCSAASVSIVHGLKASDPMAKCPLCRQPGVYGRGVRLDELNSLVKQSCPEYWRERLRSERVERVRQAKEYWESQCRVFAGY